MKEGERNLHCAMMCTLYPQVCYRLVVENNSSFFSVEEEIEREFQQ
jgi:hypothetical protein